jgi:hypothetical protein
MGNKGAQVMPFGFDENVDKTAERQKVANMMAALTMGRESAFVSIPAIMKTKTLDEKSVATVLGFIGENEKCGPMIFGSFGIMVQAMPELRRIPGDIDIQLRKVGKQEAIRFANELFARLEKIDKTLRINPDKPAIIETNKNGKWERAVDIHYAGEPPEDILSPLAPLNFQKERTQEQKLIDALDTYILSKTLLESAKKYNEDESIIGQWVKLLKRYVELWEDEIDFDKLEVKK